MKHAPLCLFALLIAPLAVPSPADAAGFAQPATLTVQADQRHDRIEPMLCGQFIEHLGRCMNGGVFEPGSLLADTNTLASIW
jgi:alpha-L-arabinofuranosidase